MKTASRTASSWGWLPPPSEGVWRHGCRWAKPFTAAAPWITLTLLLAMFGVVEGRLTAVPGLVFDLPAPVSGDSEIPGLAVVLVPVVREGALSRETYAFFDDARYSLSDAAAVEAFRERLAARAQADRSGTLLLLADGRVASGDLMRLMGLAREAGVTRVQIGERRE